jgi:hypothetical protein
VLNISTLAHRCRRRGVHPIINPGQVRFASKGVDYRGNKMALGVTGRQSAAPFENVVGAIDECRWSVESKSFSNRRPPADVRYVPRATSIAWRSNMSRRAASGHGVLLDHLVGAGEQAWGDGQVDRAGGARLIASLISVGSWIGRSEIFAPFRSRSTYLAAPT